MKKALQKAGLLSVAILMLFGASFGTMVNQAKADTTNFPDMTSTHWAYPAVLKMAMLNIIKGYADGTFKPDQQVSQEEVLVMVIQAMGLGGEAVTKANDPKRLGDPNYSPWAKGYVYEALDNGLIQAGDNFNGTNPASRAWVAQVIIRMLDKETEAGQLQTGVTDFSDDLQIPGTARGEINLAIKLGIISGFEDNTFRPANTVTRAQMAIMLSLSMPEMKQTPANLYIGQWVSSEDNQITIKDKSGVLRQFMLSTNVKYYKNNRPALGNIQPYTPVSVVISNGSAAMIEILGDTPSYIEKEAKLLKVYPDNDSIVVQMEDSTSYSPYSLNNVELVDSANRTITISALSEGDQLTLQLTQDNQLLKVIRSGTALNGNVEGVIKDLDASLGLITITKDDGSLDASKISPTLQIIYGQTRLPSLSDLKPGDRVRLERTDGVVTTITLLTKNETGTTKGTVKLISNDINEPILTIENEDGLQAYKVSNNTVIKIPGAINAQLSDVKVGDQVTLTFDNGKVTAIQITNRQVNQELSGTIETVDTDSNIITIKNADDKLFAYKLADNVELDLEDVRYPDIEDLDRGMRVQLSLNNKDEVYYLKEINGFEGTVVRINSDNTMITINTVDGTQKTYVLDRDVDVNIKGNSSADIYDVQNGDEVSLTLDTNDVVTDIDVRTTQYYTVTDVDTDYNDIDVKNQYGSRYTLDLERNVELIVPNVAYPSVDDIHVDDTVAATFLGTDLEKVEVLPTLYGTVTSVNEAGRSFNMALSDGTSKTLSYNADSIIYDSSGRAVDFGSLTKGTHVAVNQQEKGVQVKMMERISGKFNDYFESTHVLSFYKGTSTYFTNYRMAPNPYIHRGSLLLPVSALDNGDAIIVYVNDMVVYEVEQQ